MLKYGSYQVEVTVHTYQDNGNLYVGLNYYDEELDGMFPFGHITVNTGNKLGYLEAAIDVNNMGEDVVAFIVDNGLAENKGTVVHSGFCIYPVYKFSKKRLSELCPMDFARYKREHKGGK